MQPPTLGFWGAPTSSVDWCEANYAHSQYICELFNTVSSLMMVAVGLLGAYWHRHVLERRFLLVFSSVVLVGIGSAAFHGTLLSQLQMLDELPMLYTAALMLYILLEIRPGRRFGAWLPGALVGYAVLASYGAAFLRGQAQFFSFQVSFAALEFYGLYLTFRVHRQSRDRTQRRLFRAGITLYFVAIALWFVDLGFCESLGALAIPNPQLHAWWHVLVSCGLYALILVIAFRRCTELGQKPVWKRGPWGVPRIAIGPR